jgi:hypothetical protein
MQSNYFSRFDYATKKTNSAAMTTTDAQKTPMPATIKPCWDVREGGGTSGISILLDLNLIIMREPLEHLKCHGKGTTGYGKICRFTAAL